MDEADAMEKGLAQESPRTDNSMSPYRLGSWRSSLKSSFSSPKLATETSSWQSKLRQLGDRFTRIDAGRTVRSRVLVQKCK
jgi:hypothetical protein